MLVLKRGTYRSGGIGIKIVIGGDISPTSNNEKLFINGESQLLFGDILTILKNADLTIANLETVLIKDSFPINKIGPCFKNHPNCIKAIKNAGINCLSLANNHILDQGEKGIAETVKVCLEHDILTLGAGMNLSSARAPIVKKVGSMNIGIIAAAENEFCLATEERAGANPLDYLEIVKTLNNLKKEKCEFILLIIHGGKEFYEFPSPRMQKISRDLVDFGADCIVWQHSHWPGAYEEYNHGFISYGQGNLIFDYNTDDPMFYKGYLIEVELSADKFIYKVIPYKRSKEVLGIRIIEAAQDEFIQYLDNIVKQVQEPKTVNLYWENKCLQQMDWYISEIVNYSRILKKSRKRENDLNRILYKEFGLDNFDIIKILNLLECESHFETLVCALKLLFEQQLEENSYLNKGIGQ